MRQLTGGCRSDPLGGKEGKRDCHVDLADAAALAPGDALGIDVGVGKKFGEPEAAASDRRNQQRA